MRCLTLEVFSGQLHPTGLTKGCWGQFWSSLLLNVGVSEWIWLGETYSPMWNWEFSARGIHIPPWSLLVSVGLWPSLLLPTHNTVVFLRCLPDLSLHCSHLTCPGLGFLVPCVPATILAGLNCLPRCCPDSGSLTSLVPDSQRFCTINHYFYKKLRINL